MHRSKQRALFGPAGSSRRTIEFPIRFLNTANHRGGEEVENGIESTRSPTAGNFRLLRGAFARFHDPHTQVENETDQPDCSSVEVDSEEDSD